MAAGEIYDQLPANFASYPKVRALKRYGKEARATRDLYVQMLLYCRSTASGGRVPDDEIELLAYPDSEKTGMRQAGFLAGVNLVRRCDDGYYVLPPEWSGLDPVREAKEAGGSYGNHRRWHEGRRVSDPDCRFCSSSDERSHMRSDTDSLEGSDMRSVDGSVSDRIWESDTDSHSDSHSESDSDSEPPFPPQTPPIPRVSNTPPTPPAAGAKRTRRQAYDYGDDQDFQRFWDAFPVKSGKPAAYKAWLAAKARGADPEDIIAAAKRYRDDPERNPKHTKYPQGWLNDERYDDSAQTRQAPAPASWWE